MVMVTPPTTASAGNVVDLGTTNSVTIKEHILIVSTGSNYGIYGTGADQSALIAGSVYSAYIGIGIGSGTGSSVTVAKTGTVYGQYAGVICRGSDISVTNHGAIEADSYGLSVNVNGAVGGVGATIVNTGTIEADKAVIREGAYTQAVKLINSGVIEGDTAYSPLIAGHDAKDLITNKGKMIGDILLEPGNDKYDGGRGRIDGDVHGGLGNDTLIGGKEKNVFLGEGGLDKLTGGFGGDQLTGGGDRDQFIYRSTKDSTVNPTGRDTIVDFSQLDADQIHLKAIDANTHARGDQKFDFIEHASFHGKAGELRYSIVDGQTLIQADVNGDKKADFAILLGTEVELSAGDFIL